MPDTIRTVAELDDLLSEPTARDRRGPCGASAATSSCSASAARWARRSPAWRNGPPTLAGVDRRVIGVSRFSSRMLPQQLQSWGIETIAGRSARSPDSLRRLPDAPNVVYMAGMKFGTTGQEALTWAMNAYLPALVCQRYRDSRIVAFSTGNVYGLSPVGGGGSRETDPLNPVGEYAMSCLGRERMFEHFSRTFGTPMAILRLNYATELRYGVLVGHRASGCYAGRPGVADDGLPQRDLAGRRERDEPAGARARGSPAVRDQRRRPGDA